MNLKIGLNFDLSLKFDVSTWERWGSGAVKRRNKKLPNFEVNKKISCLNIIKIFAA